MLHPTGFVSVALRMSDCARSHVRAKHTYAYTYTLPMRADAHCALPHCHTAHTAHRHSARLRACARGSPCGRAGGTAPPVETRDAERAFRADPSLETSLASSALARLRTCDARARCTTCLRPVTCLCLGGPKSPAPACAQLRRMLSQASGERRIKSVRHATDTVGPRFS